MLTYVLPIALVSLAAPGAEASPAFYVYKLPQERGPAVYDEAVALACLQGVINRTGPRLYVTLEGEPAEGGISITESSKNRPQFWLDILSEEGRWLEGRERAPLTDLGAVRRLAGDALKGAVIWDPEVPATLNVATTIVGVEDGVVMSPGFADTHLEEWGLPVLHDLRDTFDGSLTGSAKNDAYHWAIENYLEKGLCSSHFLCLYEDAADAREKGDLGYVVTRDWAVYHRAFVYDLSPWGDVTPADDPDQPLGTDLRTYIRMLEANLEQSAGEHMTEVAGFFPFQKYSTVGGLQQKYEPVPTEWETVWLISRYNCYQNTAAGGCYNQSFHSQAPFEPLKQQRPEAPGDVEDKTYVCFLMADYDSTLPLYDFLPRIWDDEMRGKLPAVWGINPNLIETYPDLITYYYETAGGGDYFASDASCAGYFNPNRIREEYLPLFTRHNKRYFEQCDMTLAPMVLDWDEPTAAVKDSFVQFAPDGFATIVIDFHEEGGKLPEPHVWKGMPVLELFNEICNTKEAAPMARQMYEAIERRDLDTPAFCFFRTIWTASSVIAEAAELLKSAHPELDVEVVDPYTFFALAEKHYAKE